MRIAQFRLRRHIVKKLTASLFVIVSFLLTACWPFDGSTLTTVPQPTVTPVSTVDPPAQNKNCDVPYGETMTVHVPAGQSTTLDDGTMVSCYTNGSWSKTSPAVTVTPATIATSAPASTAQVTASDVFTYTPGGANYVFPEDGALEQVGTEGWTRIRRAANGQYLAWTFLVRVKCDRDISDNMQWDSATKLLVAGPIGCTIEIKRDLDSSKSISPDPYGVANSKKSPLGLGWFISGNGATVRVNDSDPIALKGVGVKQMAFPADWTGTWTIEVNVLPNGQVTLNQGEKLTKVDNWPLPNNK